MTPKNLFGSITTVSGILQNLDRAGMTVEIGDDFAKYRAYRNRQTDRGSIYPMFDTASSYIDDTNGFWMCGFDPSGTLIHTQAVRLLDLSGVTLARHLDIHRHKYITPDTTPDPDMTFYSGPEALETITGKVCYHGEFWVHARGLGGPRSQGTTALLSRVLFELMTTCWNPDFVFAFVPKMLGAKGAHLRYGYSHCEQGQWIGPDQQITEEDYFIWMATKDMRNVLSRPPESLQSPKMTPVPKPEIAAVKASR